MVPGPTKLADFFGNLSISSSPWGWISWFCYFASLIVVKNALALSIFGFVIFVLLVLAAWRSAIDKNKVEAEAFQVERRFVFGSGFGSILIGLAVSVAALNSNGPYLIFLLAPTTILAVTFLFVALRKQEAKGSVFNFTQCYLMLMATYTGYSTSIVGIDACSAAVAKTGACLTNGDVPLAWIFFMGWSLALGIFVFNLIKIEWNRKSDVKRAGENAAIFARSNKGDLWETRHST